MAPECGMYSQHAFPAALYGHLLHPHPPQSSAINTSPSAATTGTSALLAAPCTIGGVEEPGMAGI
jgi:hypothetical protein